MPPEQTCCPPCARWPDSLAAPWRYPVIPDADHVSRTCRAVQSDLTEAGLGIDKAAKMALICAEALNNIVEHALPGRKDGWIEVLIDPAPPGRLVFRDNGGPMQGGLPRAGSAPDPHAPRQQISEGGYGWVLIHSLAACVDYTHTDGQNIVRITLPCDQAA